MRRALAVAAIALTALAAAGAAYGADIGHARDLLARAESRAAAGAADAALRDLERARAAILSDGEAADRARYFGLLGEASRRLGDLGGAEAAFLSCRRIAEDASEPAIAAAAINGLALVAGASGRDEAGAALFEEAAETARAAGEPVAAATAWVNAARLLEASAPQDARERLSRAYAAAADAPASSALSLVLSAIGDLSGRIGGAPADQALARAETIARETGDARALSYALGLAGAAAEASGDLARADQLTADALIAAAALDAPDLDYLWRWREGRIARARGQTDRALAAYAGAVERVSAVRAALLAGFTGGRSPFRDAVEPLFLEYVDLLAEEARAAAPARRAALIADARDAVEALKAAELRDYFGDDCLAGLDARRKSVEEIAPRAAAIYPVLLEDRTLVIIGLDGALDIVETPVGRDEIVEEIRAFRALAEKRTTRQYLRPAAKLYDWLIRPLEPRLAAAGVETLVFTPDGALRTAPFAALHDGEAHLIERYAVAIAPGLDLIDPRPIGAASLNPVLLGVTEAQSGFSALPAVEAELTAVAGAVGGEVLLDGAFTERSFEEQIARAPYTIVHIASHGSFETNAGESFILTDDGRLTLDELEAAIKFSRFRDEPIELLTLSACKTAAGDDRAALGLAGVAVKAGARAALASLWSVNDAATSDLIARFYDELLVPSATKASALRAAQRAALEDRRTAHPAYWAPFLMIGNWL